MYVVENTSGSATRAPQIHKLPLPAQDEPVVWEATLALARADTPWSTVGNSNEGYGSSASPLLSATHGTLSPDSFTVGSTTHTVEILAYQTGSTPQLLFFTDTGVTKADLEGLELIITVDGAAKTLAVSSATDFSSGGTNYGIYWEDSSHGYRLYDWADKTVTVQLRTPVVDDCAGDTTTTCSVSLGSSVTGDIELVADTDYFSLSVTSGASYQIDLEGSEASMGTLADPLFFLRDASGTGLASDDDGGTGRNARIVWVASSTSTVYVDVQAFEDSTGTYTLTVSVGPADDCANNTTTTCSVSPGTPVTGDIQYSGDDDYFSLSVASGFTYQIDAEGSPTSMGTLGDTDLELRDASGTELASDVAGGTGYNARLTWTASNTLTVYVAIRSGDGGTGTYTLTVSVSNNLATGAPTISGTAQVGQTLTAATSGIMGSDGLGTFSYQWIRVDSGTDADISGATSGTYTLVAADLGKTIKVKVSFTDDASNAETLTSAATAAVAAAAQSGWDATLVAPAAAWANVGTNWEGYGSSASSWITSTTSFGTLSPDSFTVGTTTYTVEVLAFKTNRGDELYLTTDPVVKTANLEGFELIITVDGVAKTLAVSEGADILVGSTYYGIEWEKSVHGYSAGAWTGETITVELREPNTVPDAITDLSAVAGNTQAALSWTVPGDGGAAITEFEYRQKTDGAYGSWLDISGSGATTASHTVTGLTNGTEYTFQVRAVNSVGNAADSNDATATPASGAPIVPGAPTGLTATEGHHAVKLNWTAPAADGGSAITGYEYTPDTVLLAPVVATGNTSPTHIVDNLADNNYAFVVRAVNAVGPGPWSSNADAAIGTVGPATVTIAGDGGVTEGTDASFTLTASKPVLSSNKPLNVSVSVSESEDMVASAEEGAKTVSFAVGDTTATLSVPTVNDGVVESDSVVTAAIQTNTDYTVGTDGSGTVTVADNDTTVNNPATGAPTISGTAQVGQTLTAATSGIMDSDGLATPGYTYQWIRVDGGTDANISGATSITYTLVAADLGKTIKVKVSFTDDASNAETLTSTATAAVTAAVTDDCAETTTTTCSVSLGSSVTGDIESNNDADYFSLALTSGVTYQIDAEGSDTSKGTLDDPFLYLRNASGTELASNEDGGTGRNARIVWTATSTETGYVDVQDSSATNTGTYTLTVSVATVPDAIADLSARPGNTQVTLSWTAFDDGGSTITKFEYRQKTSGSYGSWMDISNSPSTVSHTVTGLTTGTAYTFQVRAMNGVGNAGVSNEATATPGYAQSGADVTYVSNIGQGSDDDYSSSNVRAQTFTTGSRAGGYTVTSVDIGSDDAQGDSFTVNISITDPTSGNPVAKVATLTVPTSFTAGTLTFTAPPYTVLEPNTTYALTITVDSNGVTLDTTLSNGEDAGRTSGWSIGNTAHRVDGNNWAETTDGESIRIAINGPANPARGAPTITGTAQVGETLTAVTSGISDADGLTSPVYTYQWIRVDGGTDAHITGATSITYVPVAADTGKTIRVRVRFTDDLNYSEERTSAATAAVNAPATDEPTISGITQVGETLTADPSLIMDANGLTSPGYTYQWIRVDGTDTDISGATSNTYTLVVADNGKTIKVRVRFSDDDGYSEERTSAATAAVSPPPPAGLLVSIAVDAGDEQIIDQFIIGIGVPKAKFRVSIPAALTANLNVTINISEVSDTRTDLGNAQTADHVAAADEGNQTVTIAAGDTSAVHEVEVQRDETFEQDGVVRAEVAPGFGYRASASAPSADVRVLDTSQPYQIRALHSDGSPLTGGARLAHIRVDEGAGRVVVLYECVTLYDREPRRQRHLVFSATSQKITAEFRNAEDYSSFAEQVRCTDEDDPTLGWTSTGRYSGQVVPPSATGFRRVQRDGRWIYQSVVTLVGKITDDQVYDPDETFRMALQRGPNLPNYVERINTAIPGVSSSSSSSHLVTILDDARPPANLEATVGGVRRRADVGRAARGPGGGDLRGQGERRALARPRYRPQNPHVDWGPHPGRGEHNHGGRALLGA